MKMESKLGEMESQFFGKNKEHDKKLERLDAKFKHELEELKGKLENVKGILSHLESTKKHVDEVNHNLLLQLDREVTQKSFMYYILLVLFEFYSRSIKVIVYEITISKLQFGF